MADLATVTPATILYLNKIDALECEKIVKISAGDKHSAAINSRFELFIWG